MILDVAIGLILLFLLLSIVASTVREALEGVVNARAVQLERGIRAIFDDAAGSGLATEFYRHPLISSLYRGDYEWVEKRRIGGRMPSYIPARNFAVAVLDMAVRRPVPAPYAAYPERPALTMDALRASVERIESPFLRRALLAALDSARGDVGRVQRNIEDWFDASMDRVSGWYKRRTQAILLGIGLLVAIGADVDAVRVAQHLYRSPESRAAAVRVATRIVADSARADSLRRAGGPAADSARSSRARAAAALEDLDSLRLPIFWQNVTRQTAAAHAVRSLPGWLLTAIAVSFGAPFWFDLLNKIMVIRSTVKPHEKSPEESSEDRQPRGAQRQAQDGDALAAATASATAAAVAAALAPNGTAAAPAASAPAASVPPATPEPAHVPRAWADGVEDGLL